MTHPPKRVYAITLRKAHSFMKAEGFDPEALLANTEMSEADLADPYNLVSEDQARMYYLNLVRLADRDGVGLEIGWLTALSDMGPHGMALMTARTVRESLEKTWELRDNYNVLVDWEYTVSDNLLTHTVRCNESDEQLRTFLIERGLATLQAHAEELIGGTAKPVRVLFDYKSPTNFDRYKEIFRCPLRFSQEKTQLCYPSELFERPIETYDRQAGEVLGALRVSLHERLSSGGDIVHDVKMALRREPGKFPSVERIAEGLAMSSRTLRRKLGQHDVRYQDLLEAERRRVAEDLLLNTTMSIQQIADQCGFNDAQNFSQAFRRWQDMTPTEFRNSRN
jgi:AraC-like DNA-binding protein